MKVLAADISKEAIEVALKNILINDVIDQIELLKGDLFEALGGFSLDNSFDMITVNPPYVKSAEIEGLQREVGEYEPRCALDGGRDGLEVIRKIIDKAPEYLKHGATLVMELGFGQAGVVKRLFEEDRRYCEVSVVKDLSVVERVVRAKRV